MKLQPYEFQVIADKAAGSEPTAASDSCEYEFTTEDSEASEASADIEKAEDTTEQTPVDWTEVFDEASWNSTHPEAIDASKILSDEVRDAVKKKHDDDYKAGAKKKYSISPWAAQQDRLLQYDETNKTFVSQYEVASMEVQGESKSIANQLRRVLFTRSIGAVERDRTRGRIDRRKLHTIASPAKLNPNKRIFTRKVEGKSQNVAIALLVDQSGSMMEWGKMEAAKSCAIALGDALSNLTPLGVKFGVWGFDTTGKNRNEKAFSRYEGLQIHEYKTFADDWRKVAPRTGAIQFGNNNIDGESIRFAARKLMETDCERRILIVLSDGMPAGYADRAALNADLALAVEQCEGFGVETIGVGFMSNAVKKFYPKFTVVHDKKDLGPTVINLFRDVFAVGRK